MNLKTAADVRAFLNHRAAERPRNEIPVMSMDGTTARLRIFDAIDSWGEWWGMSAKEFAAALDELPSHIDTVELLINSPGGDVFDGLAIVNTMRAHQARTVAVVQGIAASAASFIAAAADELVMAPNSTLMIHDAWGICVGNATDMAATAGMLDKTSGNLAEIYAAKAGTPVDEWREAMKAETWYTADEAVAAGLADRVVEQPARTEARATLADEISAATSVVRGVLEKAAQVSASRAATGEKLSNKVTESLNGLRESLDDLIAEPAGRDQEDTERAVALAAFEARRRENARRLAAINS